jgi:hypothetical protein
MNFLKRIANSSFVTSYCRWPSAIALRLYWCIVAVFSIVTTVQASTSVYHHAVSTGATPHDAIAHTLAVGFAILVGWGFYGLVCVLLWAMCYRMLTEVAAGFRYLRARAPGARRSIGRAAAGIVTTVRNMPTAVSGFFRSLPRALVWLAGRPAWWRNLTARQKLVFFWDIGMLALVVASYVVMYPLARHIVTALSWLGIFQHWPILNALIIDIILGSFASLFVVAGTAIAFSTFVRRNPKR